MVLLPVRFALTIQKNLTLGNNILSYTIKDKILISDSLWVQIFESSGFCHICSLTAMKIVFWYPPCKSAPWGTEKQKVQWGKIITTHLCK